VACVFLIFHLPYSPSFGRQNRTLCLTRRFPFFFRGVGSLRPNSKAEDKRRTHKEAGGFVTLHPRNPLTNSLVSFLLMTLNPPFLSAQLPHVCSYRPPRARRGRPNACGGCPGGHGAALRLPTDGNAAGLHQYPPIPPC